MRRPLLLLVASPVLPLLALAAPAAALEIHYQVESLEEELEGSSLWRYTYTLSSATFEAGEGFTVFFHPEEFAAVFAGPSPSSDWDVLTRSPDPLLPDFGIFDALALVGSPDTSVSFRAIAEFTGEGEPADQPFVHYASDFSPLATGATVPVGVPEPGVLLLLGAALLAAAAISRRTRGVAVAPFAPRSLSARRRLAAPLLVLCAGLPVLLAPTCRTLDPVVNEVVLGDFVLRTWLDETVRTGRTEAEYRYAGELENRSAASASGVMVAVQSLTSATLVLDSMLAFGEVPAGGTVSSQDTYAITHDREQAFDPSLLEYAVFEDAIPTALDFAGTVGSAGGLVAAPQEGVALDFPPEAVSEAIDIRISPLENVGFPGVIRAFDLGPDGVSFAEDVTLIFNYDEAEIPFGVNEEDLFIAASSHTSSALVPLPSTVDPVANNISASISGFSSFMYTFSCETVPPGTNGCPVDCTFPPPVSPDDSGGDLDPTFGTAGVFTFDLGLAGATGVRDLHIDDQGRLLIASELRRMSVVRVLPDGEGLDPGFGFGGVAEAFTQTDTLVTSLAVRNDGRIVLHGARQPAGGLELALARFLPDGLLDPSFGGGDGIVLDLRKKIGGLGKVAALPDGRVLVSDPNARSLFQFLEDGSPDPAFGADGIAEDQSFGGTRMLRRATGDWLMGVGTTARVVDASGNPGTLFPNPAGLSGGPRPVEMEEIAAGHYVLGGTKDRFSFEDGNFWATRLRPGDTSGSLEGDQCFGVGGAWSYDFGGGEVASDLAVQADGRIVLVGATAHRGDDDDAIVVRVRPDGELDAGFGDGGILYLDFGGDDTADAVTIDAQGRIVVVGSSRVGDSLFGDRVGVVVRLLP